MGIFNRFKIIDFSVKIPDKVTFIKLLNKITNMSLPILIVSEEVDRKQNLFARSYLKINHVMWVTNCHEEIAY